MGHLQITKRFGFGVRIGSVFRFASDTINSAIRCGMDGLRGGERTVSDQLLDWTRKRKLEIKKIEKEVLTKSETELSRLSVQLEDIF